MDVSDMKVTDEDSFLSRSMIKAENIIMKERICIVKLTIRNRVAKVDVEPNATSRTV